MEQTNLVVTPDGKTWDEVTRDTSYIGNKVMETAYGGGNGSLTPIDFDMWRGTHGASRRNFMQKDWAIACNRYICLRAGSYRIRFNSYDHSGALQVAIRKNAVVSSTMLANMVYSRVSAADNHVHVEATEYFSRGDFFTLGSVSGNMDGTTATPRTSFSIYRV